MAKKEKRPIGRPSGLTDKHQDGAVYYLKEGFRERGDVVPSLSGLACFLGTSRKQVQDWGKANPIFLSTLEAIKTSQENLLINGGLLGDYNPTITKLMLANHGYSDKVESDHTSSDGSMTPITKIELVAKK